MSEVRNYFELCKNYWLRNGDTEAVATSKAFWWDCVEVWNFDNTWDAERKDFAMEMRGYEPYHGTPDPSKVSEGAV